MTSMSVGMNDRIKITQVDGLTVESSSSSPYDRYNQLYLVVKITRYIYIKMLFVFFRII